MKSLTALSKLFFAIVFIAMGTAMISTAFETDPLLTGAALTVASLFYQSIVPQGVFAIGLLTDVWTGEFLKKFRYQDVTFMQGIPDFSQYVDNDTIKLINVGVDPAVLINNTTYPIAANLRVDADIAVTLDKFDTENTIITDDELHGLPYDKKGSVLEQHQLVMEDKTAEKAAHSLAPTSNAALTPVLRTTGALVGSGVTARRKLIIDDLIRLQKAFNDMRIPQAGRRLVLCNQHQQDLLQVSETYEKQYNSIAEGKQVPKMYGFEIHSFGYAVQYVDNDTTTVKKAFGAAAVAANDCDASFAFYIQRAMTAKGTIMFYQKDAKTDPQYRQSMFGIRMYFLCLPKKAEGFGAIVSAKV
jgi:hypothetical protein